MTRITLEELHEGLKQLLQTNDRQIKVTYEGLLSLTRDVDDLWTEVTVHGDKIASPTEPGHVMPDGVTTEVDPATGKMKVIGSGKGAPFVEATWDTATSAYIVTLDGVTAYTEGLALSIKTASTNVAAAQININNLGKKGIMSQMDTQNVQANQLMSGYVYTLVYNGYFFILQGGGVKLNDTLNTTSRFEAATANAVRQLNDLKANKAQDSLLTITGMNSWALGSTKYFKDNFGIVHVYFIGSSGAKSIGAIISQFPVGYRPQQTVVIPTVATTALGTNAQPLTLALLATGELQVNATLTQDYVFAAFSFRT